MKYAFLVLSVVAALVTWHSVAWADDAIDTVRLTNGGRLRGTVIVDDPSGVQVQLADGTTRKLKRQEVKTIEYAEHTQAAPPAVTVPPAPSPLSAPVAPAPGRVLVSFEGKGLVSIGPLSCQAPCDMPVPPGSYDVTVDAHPVRTIEVGAEPTARFRVHRGGAVMLIIGASLVIVGSALVSGGLAMTSGKDDSTPAVLMGSGAVLDLAGCTLAIIGAVQAGKRKLDPVRSEEASTWLPRVMPWATAERGAHGAVGGIAFSF
jgi:hypothetical protein